MSNKSLEEILKELSEVDETIQKSTEEEILLSGQIAALRARLSELQGNRSKLRAKRVQLDREKASAERIAAVAAQQEKIEQEINELRKEADKLLSDAKFWPPVDTLEEGQYRVLTWQFEGALQAATAQRAIIADKRGMGKTLSSVVWRRLVKSKKTLVLTRKQYTREFIKELSFWEPNLSIVPLIGPSPFLRQTVIDMMKTHDEFVIVANFEQWRRNTDKVIEELKKIKWDSIILDEAHQLKTFQSVTTRGFMKLIDGVPKLLEMTGTPVQNRPQELFAILHAAYPTLFPRPNDFLRDYCIQLGQNRWGWRPGGLETLTKKISKFFIARTPDDVGHKIPPPHIEEIVLDFEGHQQQAELYKQMVRRSLAELSSGEVLSIPGQLALMTRLAQTVVWPPGIEFPAYTTGFDGEEKLIRMAVDVYESVKMDWAEDFIAELVEEDQRVIVFSRFKAPLQELYDRLTKNGISTVRFTGDTKSDALKDEISYDFDLKTAPKNPKYSVLLGTYDTIGEALNLNAARHAILLDRYWKPSRDDQAMGRIDRLNSVDRANIYMPSVEGTIDDYMIELIEEKRAVLNDFKSASEMQNRLRDHLERSL